MTTSRTIKASRQVSSSYKQVTEVAEAEVVEAEADEGDGCKLLLAEAEAAEAEADERDGSKLFAEVKEVNQAPRSLHLWGKNTSQTNPSRHNHTHLLPNHHQLNFVFHNIFHFHHDH